jgi:hypothetical protein
VPAVTVASFNVENLFARPRAFDTIDRTVGEPILAAYREFKALIARPVYSQADQDRMRELLVEVDVYRRTTHGAVRRHFSRAPRWALLRKNRGSFDREPVDLTADVQITATGRGTGSAGWNWSPRPPTRSAPG